MKYDFESYERGKEAFWDILHDYNVPDTGDYCVGILHAAIEWIEELNLDNEVARTLRDSGFGITGHIM